MNRLTEAIWMMEPSGPTDRPVLALVRGARRSLMIDGGNCPDHAGAFIRELSEAGLAEPDYVATTHSHCDHVFGLSALGGLVLSNSLTRQRIEELNRLGWNDAEVAERVRAGQEHEMTLAMLREEMPGDRTGFTIRRPDIVYDSRLEVSLGGLACCLEKIGGNHTPDSTVVMSASDAT